MQTYTNSENVPRCVVARFISRTFEHNPKEAPGENVPRCVVARFIALDRLMERFDGAIMNVNKQDRQQDVILSKDLRSISVLLG
jgi:hypothetical protein